MERGRDTHRRFAEGVEDVLVGKVAGGDDAHARLRQAALREALDETDRLRARWQEQEQRVGTSIAHPLQEGREVRVADRHAHLADDLAAGGSERLLELCLGVLPWPEIGDQRVDALQLVLRRPGGDRRGVLRQRVRDANDVGRARGDHRGGRVHHHHRLLRLSRERRYRERGRRQAEAGENVDVVLDHQLLRQPLADVAGGAGVVVANDQLDLAAGDRIAVSGEIEADAVLDLLAIGPERPGHRQHQTNLDRLGAERDRRHRQRQGCEQGQERSSLHRVSWCVSVET